MFYKAEENINYELKLKSDCYLLLMLEKYSEV
jgi:hypothetical protein